MTYLHEREWKQEEQQEKKKANQTEAQTPICMPEPVFSYGSAMQVYLSERNLDWRLAEHNGWYPSEFHGPRIIIPCLRQDGLSWFQGRLIGNDPQYKRWDSPHGPRGDAVAYVRNSYRQLGTHLVVVEGPMDALAAAMAGADAVALLGIVAPGKVLAHVAMIAQRYPRSLLIADGDAIPAWAKVQDRLGYMGLNAPLVTPSPYKDLAQVPPEQRSEIVNVEI